MIAINVRLTLELIVHVEMVRKYEWQTNFCNRCVCLHKGMRKVTLRGVTQRTLVSLCFPHIIHLQGEDRTQKQGMEHMPLGTRDPGRPERNGETNKEWTGFIWLRIGTSGGILETR
jgi:hypothetical protein